MAKNPFKVGDKVYVYPYGWGEVNEYSTHTLKSHVIFPNKICGEWADTKLISFTEYDPIKGGLSHEQPKEWSIGLPFQRGQLDSHGDIHAKGCFDSNFVKAMKDVPVAGSGRGRKALNYIKKLLKDNYNVVEDFISVEELGDEVQVSLTFRKG